MASSCKHMRWCSASLLNSVRGRGFSTKSVGVALVEALQPHVNESGQHLLPILRDYFHEKERQWEKEKLEKEKQWEKEKHFLEKLWEKEKELLEREKELRARVYIELLKARGLNNTCGLFEYIQEILLLKVNITSSRLKGSALWEAILKVDVHLARCIQKCTGVLVSNVAKQALHCYNVYSMLSQHVHDGKSLAELLATQGETILFERGPLSSEQVRVFECMGASAKVMIVENKDSRIMTRL